MGAGAAAGASVAIENFPFEELRGILKEMPCAERDKLTSAIGSGSLLDHRGTKSDTAGKAENSEQAVLVWPLTDAQGDKIVAHKEVLMYRDMPELSAAVEARCEKRGKRPRAYRSDSPIVLADAPCSDGAVGSVANAYSLQGTQRVILCFGDSLTAGLSRKDQRLTPYSERLRQVVSERCADQKNIPAFVTAGVGGETTSEMCRRLPGLLKMYEGLIDAVLILGGTNDLGDVLAETTVQNLEQLHRMSHAAGAWTGALTVPDCMDAAVNPNLRPHDKDQAHINAALHRFAAQNSDRTFVVDVAASLPQDDTHSEMWASDGVHLSPKGYEALGSLVADAVMSKLPQDILQGASMQMPPATF